MALSTIGVLILCLSLGAILNNNKPADTATRESSSHGLIAITPSTSAAAVARTPPVVPTTSKPTPRHTPSHKPAPTAKKPKPAPTKPAQVYYKNCAAVRAAGAAPIHRGDPGYAPRLDRDGDGVGCE